MCLCHAAQVPPAAADAASGADKGGGDLAVAAAGAGGGGGGAAANKNVVAPVKPPPSTLALWLNAKGKRLRSIGPDMNKELARCVPGKRVPAHRCVAVCRAWRVRLSLIG